MSELLFPLSTRALSEWLPHREQALWVDEVSWVKQEEGECRVYLRSDANYADQNKRIRPSSFIEWMAQSYGFVAATQALSGLIEVRKKPEKTFLVQIRNLIVSATDHKIVDQDWISVHVKRTHQMGPLTLLEGTVTSSQSLVLASAKLKVFAE
jgi:predicted hotdog family 3-hydroxylacyl-ACP dehydratase